MVATALVGCSSTESSSQETPPATVSSTTTEVIPTTSVVLPEATVPPTTEATPSGLSAAEVLPASFADVELIEAPMGARLADFVTADEGVAEQVTSVEVRRALVGELDVGQVVAVALRPEFAFAAGVDEELVSGMLSSSAVAAGSLRVGPETLSRFRAGDASGEGPVWQLVWRHVNVVLVVSGLDSAAVDGVARDLVEQVAGPFPLVTAPVGDPPAAGSDEPSS